MDPVPCGLPALPLLNVIKYNIFTINFEPCYITKQIRHQFYKMSEAVSRANEISETFREFVEDGSNKLAVKCKFCGSTILDIKSGKFVIQEMDLPLMHQDTRKVGDTQKEKISEFYYVENKYTFENIGFTLTVDNYRYLSCADCDAGPVGYYDMNTKHSYVALSRVKHA